MAMLDEMESSAGLREPLHLLPVLMHALRKPFYH